MEEGNTRVTQEEIEKEQLSEVDTRTTNLPQRYWLYGGILLLLCIVVLFRINEIKSTPPVVYKAEVVSEPILSAEELEEERSVLRMAGIVNVSDSNLDVFANQTIRQESKNPSELETSKFTTAEEVAEIVSINQPVNLPESTKFESNGTGIKANKVTLTNNATKSEKVNAVEIEGVVFSIDQKNKFITLTNQSGTYRINVDTDTKFLINNSRFTFEDLRSTDIILVRGKRSKSSNEIEANTVVIIGLFELNDTVN